ncbi:ParB/Srx family N-terminal domain-containing protein [Companilactobacillus allii]|nr:ParB/Srx family N-terminal domain-containing protein [Companilactobacillus allii]USQ68504.1 ParB/Srx family N-terminal domain-containing protein [Companilactobacillus allii]
MISLNELINKNEVVKTNAVKKLSISGVDKTNFDVYRIPLKYLYYNNQNGRINTAYKRFIVKRGIDDFAPATDNQDPEYNQILENLIYNSNKESMRLTMDSIDEKGQQEPGVVLNDGRVIDGNRRYTALRKIESRKEISQYFEAVILPLDMSTDIDKKNIKLLEVDLQFGREEKIDYDPIDRVFDVYDAVKVQKIVTAKEYAAKKGNKNVRTVNTDIEEAKLIIEYLQFVNAPENAYYLAKDMKLDGPMHEISRALRKYKGKDKSSVREVIFAVLSSLYSKGGDITRDIRKILENIIDTPQKSKYLNQTQDFVDDIYDAYHNEKSNVIENAEDVSTKIVEDKNAGDSAEQLLIYSNQLVRRGKSDEGRKKALNNIRSALNDVTDVSNEDIKALNADEYKDAIDVLNKLYHIVGNLKEIKYYD